MSININTTGSYGRSQISGFYVKGIYCYDTFCSEHPLQWAPTFDVANNTDVITVTTEALGDYPPGVYARIDTATTGGVSRFPWRLVVPYEDFVRHCSNIQSKLRVVFAASANEALDTDLDILYRNGERRPTSEGVVADEFNVYGIITPIEGTEEGGGPKFIKEVDLIQKKLGPYDAAWTDTDPELDLLIDGTQTRQIKLANIQSGGGFKLGAIVVDFT